MQHYLIVKVYLPEPMQADFRELGERDREDALKNLRALAKEAGAELFFFLLGSELQTGDAFAEAEYNFPLESRIKQEIADLIAPFFRDAQIRKPGKYVELAVSPIPFAIRFLQTEGELVYPA